MGNTIVQRLISHRINDRYASEKIFPKRSLPGNKWKTLERRHGKFK
ncbi:MAG TPA: hypothetical protein PLI52_01355 [Prochlorococcaceae cyanobacterium AMR_MDS_5431]|nr:hypothetical protein [Prochlorococcaceae cyanobacterium AMR_MDS_5431]